MLDVDFWENPKILQENFMDMYEGVFLDVITSNRLDENVDLSTTYLGKVGMNRDEKVKAEERFPISGQGYTVRKILDGTECQILLDTGASKSYMFKSFYL